MNSIADLAGLMSAFLPTADHRREGPYNGIISLLEVNRPFNLAESTSQALTVGDVLDMAGLETLRP